jgi:hypothetical protein
MECKIMSDIPAVAQFEALVEKSENGRPPCEDVRRLLEAVRNQNQREILENQLKNKSENLRVVRPDSDFHPIYSDGVSEMYSGPDGKYFIMKIPIVESYTDSDS